MSDTKAWVEAFRLRTLPLAFSSILMGSFLAVAAGLFDWVILGLSLLTTLFLQVLSNLANDFGDSASGVDGETRKGPQRMVQAGKISSEAMRRALYVCGALALVSGLGLILYAFWGQSTYLWVFFLLGVAAIAAAVKYTVGKSPYGYQGLGDLFVLLFFGFVGVVGSYFLYVRQLDGWVLLPAMSCGLFAVGVLNVNNIRDIESDREAGKRSIPVRLGKRRASVYHLVLILTGWLLVLAYSLGQSSHLLHWIYWLVFPLFVRNVIVVFRKEGADLDPYLKQLAISSLLFVLLFGAGVLLYP